MLVLSRRVGETILIGRDTFVTVARINGGKVRLAIGAPPEVPVHRFEVAEAIARETGEGEGARE